MEMYEFIPSNFTYKTYCSTYSRQKFLLPDSVIFYVTKNPPSPKMFQKMCQCCKFFFIKNQILVIECLKFEENEWKIGSKVNLLNYEHYKTFPLKEISRSKLWINYQLSIYSIPAATASNIIPKIYKSNTFLVEFIQQDLSLKEFLFLSKTAKKCYLESVNIYFRDGTKVPLEFIVSNLLNLTHIHCEFCPDKLDHTPNIFQQILKIPHAQNIVYFGFNNVYENFEFDVFYKYIKNKKNVCSTISYRNPISNGLKGNLEAIIDEVLDTKCHHFIPPFIEFPGLDEEKQNTLISHKKGMFEIINVFEKQINQIIEQISRNADACQVLMCSATWSKEVHTLASNSLVDPVRLDIGSLELSANQNVQQYVEVIEESRKKDRLFENFLRKTIKGIIFRETKRKADDLANEMCSKGWPTLCIHGDKSQKERDAIQIYFNKN